jgi:hypothetical protein
VNVRGQFGDFFSQVGQSVAAIRVGQEPNQNGSKPRYQAAAAAASRPPTISQGT